MTRSTKNLTALTLAASLLAGTAQADWLSFDTRTLEVYGTRVGNPVEPATWWNGHGAGMAEMAPLRINPMDPDFWMAFIQPDRHGQAHMTFMNPATMAQFLEMETYSAMMDPGIWAKWFDPGSYAPLADPQVYAYWMQPGAYAHMLDIGQVQPMLETGNYSVVLSTAADTFGLSDWAELGGMALAALSE